MSEISQKILHSVRRYQTHHVVIVVALAVIATVALNGFKRENLHSIYAFHTIPEVELMDTSRLANGSQAMVAGYYTPGDQGGGSFAFSAKSTLLENRGTVIAPRNGGGRWTRVANGPLNVRWFGAIGNGVADDTISIKAAIAAAAARGGIVFVPPGVYKTSSMITIPSMVELRGAGGKGNPQENYALGASVIHAVHREDSILSLVGSAGCRISNLTVFGDARISPKTGILLGRSRNLGSAGSHTFYDVQASGYFTKAAICSVASENNRWIACQTILNGGGALYCFYTSEGDGLGLGNLPGATNIDVAYVGLTGVNYVNDSSASFFYIDAGDATIAHTFLGGYFGAANGSYVTIRIGYIDNSNCPGPICFYGTSGEGAGANAVKYGFTFLAQGLRSLNKLVVDGCSFRVTKGGAFINRAEGCSLVNSRINE